MAVDGHSQVAVVIQRIEERDTAQKQAADDDGVADGLAVLLLMAVGVGNIVVSVVVSAVGLGGASDNENARGCDGERSDGGVELLHDLSSGLVALGVKRDPRGGEWWRRERL